ILLCHGFPDLWYGWRYIIPLLVKAGYKVIVPDLPGYGQTEQPKELENLTFAHICEDLNALLDRLDIPTVTLLGHDWGGMVVWRMVNRYPKRIKAVISLCTPYTPANSQFVPLDKVIQAIPSFKYQQKLFATEEAVESFNENLEGFFQKIYQSGEAPIVPYDEAHPTSSTTAPSTLILNDQVSDPSTVSPRPELDYYMEQFRPHGLYWPLGWYRTRKLNFDADKALERKIDRPCLMICAEKDQALPPSLTNGMDQWIADLDI
ncbi:Alpha/Beta hydrolase protein, partial [Piptocephalis cylindrospora]